MNSSLTSKLLVTIIIIILLFSQISQIAALERIDINSAGATDLQKITGIGPVTAEKIIEKRKTCYFYPLSSLTEVKGIGPITLQKIESEGKAFTLPPEKEGTVLCRLPVSSEKEKIETPIIDINSAPLEELTKISGIGESKAKELISLRPFYSLEDLTKIKGVGDKTLQSIKEQQLAWVDPELSRKEESVPPKENIPVDSGNKQAKEKDPSFPFFPASLLAFSSGALILTLKRELNLEKNAFLD